MVLYAHKRSYPQVIHRLHRAPVCRSKLGSSGTCVKVHVDATVALARAKTLVPGCFSGPAEGQLAVWPFSL